MSVARLFRFLTWGVDPDPGMPWPDDHGGPEGIKPVSTWTDYHVQAGEIDRRHKLIYARDKMRPGAGTLKT